jgi:aspartyl-tRNA(Asn)/glutamyl-tRNA(Gln) amidotransferase subunit C
LLTPDDILRLCRLARVEIKAVDTKGVVPMAHPLERAQRLRDDRVTETDRHELYQRNAPLVERDLYLVPKVIE